jgi:tetratricopeptide (TPR) repeat protein
VGNTLNWLNRRARPLSPTDLRDALLAALNVKDYPELMRLINANAAAIHESFPTWMKVPAEYRNDSVALEGYANMLMMLARVFEQSGDASLMTRLGANNPLGDVKNELATAEVLIKEMRAEEAVSLLKTVVNRLDKLSGTAVDEVRPLVLGRLGIALFNNGDKREAAKMTLQALELCRSRGDKEGVLTYTNNLEAIGTFDMPAGDDTDEHVTVRARNEEGRTLTLDELRTGSGTFTWDLRYGASIARQLVERFPSYAPAWDEHAQCVDDPRERFDIIERGWPRARTGIHAGPS